MASKVAEDGVIEATGASVGFDHHHLVAGLGVDVLVCDLGDACVGAEGADGTAARPVAEDGLNEDVSGRALIKGQRQKRLGSSQVAHLDRDTLRGVLLANLR